MELDAFLRQKNIERYRKLLDSFSSATERQTIFKLLTEEMEKRKDKWLLSPGTGDQPAR